MLRTEFWSPRRRISFHVGPGLRSAGIHPHCYIADYGTRLSIREPRCSLPNPLHSPDGAGGNGCFVAHRQKELARSMVDTAALRTVLGAQTTDKSVHAQALLQVIESAPTYEERAELLVIVLTERDSVPKTPHSLPNKGIQNDDWQALTKTHADMIDGYQKMAFFKSRTPHDFAKEILRFLEFFNEEDERTYTLANTIWSEYVPFQELPGTPVHMTGAEYGHKLKSEPKKTHLIDYIVGLPFEERTERSSMILQVVDDTTDRDLRVALLSHAFYKSEQRAVDIMRLSRGT
jgi:hypothetical protein